MEYKDYYATLGVDRKATPEAIKGAYRKLARKFHPDVSKEPNATQRFQEVQEAYEVLKDPQKRTAYDQLGSQWQNGQDFRPPPNWQDAAGFGQGSGFNWTGNFGDEQMGGGGFSDFFEALFNQAGRGRGAGARGGPRHHQPFEQRGQDQHAKIQISLEEASKGASKEIYLQVPTVNAQGHVQNTTRTLKITIPAGVTSGQQLRLAKQGLPGVGQGPAGDLYLEIEIAPHHLFNLQGKDVYLNLPLTPWEAALGAKITVPTLGGPVDMKIAAGAQSGQKLRLKGRGLGGKTPGDQYILLQIMTPPANTDAAKALYSKMAETMPYDPRANFS